MLASSNALPREYCPTREANEEHAVDEATTPIDRFIREEAVLRLTPGTRNVSGEDSDEDGMILVGKVDEAHLQRVLDQVPICDPVLEISACHTVEGKDALYSRRRFGRC